MSRATNLVIGSAYNDAMAMTAADVRRWVANFEAAERADMVQRRQEGPRPEWSIAASLSLLNTARHLAGDRPLIDPRRAEDDEAVRVVWDRLRSRLRS